MLPCLHGCNAVFAILTGQPFPVFHELAGQAETLQHIAPIQLAVSPEPGHRIAEFTPRKAGQMENLAGMETWGDLSLFPVPRERSAFSTACIPILVTVLAGRGAQLRWK